MNTIEPHRRRIALLASSGVLCATFPTLALLPLRQSHVLSDAPYFMGVGFCLGVAVVLLVLAMKATLHVRPPASLREPKG